MHDDDYDDDDDTMAPNRLGVLLSIKQFRFDLKPFVCWQF